MIKHKLSDYYFKFGMNGDTSLCKLCKHAMKYNDTWGFEDCEILKFSDYELSKILDAGDSGSEYLIKGVEYKIDDANVNSERWQYISKCEYFRLDKEKYKEYLNLESWKKFAKEIKLSKGCKCEMCGSEWNLNVHHLNYECLYKETEHDVVCVCKECHKKIHSKVKER